MKGFQLSKKFWVAFTISVFMGIAFFIYFFVYVGQQERKLVGEKFRALRRTGQNVLEAKENFKRNIMLRTNTYFNKYIISEAGGYATNEFSNWVDHFNDSVKSIKMDISFWTKEHYEKSRLEAFDSVFVKCLPDTFDTYKELGVLSDGFKNQYVVLGTTLENFLRKKNVDLKRNFEEALLIKIFSVAKDEGTDQSPLTNVGGTIHVVPQVLSKKPSTNAEIAYQTFSNQIRLQDIDSLLYEESGLYSGRIRDITLHSEKFKVFTHRIKFENQEDWLLCGLIREETFVSETREVELFYALVAAFLVIFLLLAMPVIKLMVMSAIERLQISNIWFIGFSIITGTSIVALIIITGSHYLEREREIDVALSKLSTKIEGGINSELRNVYAQLDYFRSIQADYFGTGGDATTGVEKEDRKYRIRRKKDCGTDSWQFGFTKKSFDVTSHYPWFNEVFWLDSLGEQSLTIATHGIEADERPIRLKDRRYFSAAYNDSLWALPSENLKDMNRRERFTLQSIRSWLSGNNEAGISIKLNSMENDSYVEKNWKPRVLAMATNLFSVMDALLPPGYGFCVVDEKGEVWFHSDTKRNLQENLFEEIHPSSLVKSAVLGRDTITTTFTYDDKNMKGFTRPITNTPLSLVTFYDREYGHAPMNLSASYTFILLLSMFSLIGIHLLLLFVSTYQSTRLKIKRFFLSWLRPHMDGTDNSKSLPGFKSIPPSDKYARSIITQVILIFFLIAMIFLVNDRWLVNCFIHLPCYLLLFQFFLMRREYMHFQNHAINEDILVHPILRYRWLRHPFLRHPFFITSCLLIILTNILTWQFIENGWASLIVQAIIAGICMIGYKISLPSWWMVKSKLLRKYFEFPWPFFANSFLWLLLVSVLSTICFYKNSYHEESFIWNRFIQLQTANRMFAREKLIERKYQKNKWVEWTTPEDYRIFLNGIKSMGDYSEATDEISILSDETAFLKSGIEVLKNEQWMSDNQQADLNIYNIIFQQTPVLNDLIDESRKALIPSTADQKWSWIKDDHDQMMQYKTNDQDKNYFLTSTIKPYYGIVNAGGYWVVMLALTLIAFFLVYRIIIFCVKHIFGVGWINPDKMSKPIDPKILHDNSDRRIFIVGLPYSGKSLLVKQIKNPECDVIDFRNPPFFAKGYKRAIVEHFEYGINNHKMNQEKLKVLEGLLGFKETRHITILSSIQPSVVVDFYDKMIAEVALQGDKPEARVEMKEYKYASRFWKNILSGFTIHYQPLGKSDLVDVDDKIITSRLLNSELSHGSYLPRIAKSLDCPMDHDPLKMKEEVILRVGELAENYYQSLWNSFSNEEKFLLYDLAKDRFVNLRNLKVIRSLSHKGVVVMEDSLRIMNRSFSDFILSVVKEDEEMKMVKEQQRTGTWNTVQLSLILVLLGAASFVALARQGLLGNLNAIITAFTGVITLIARFGGLFTGSKLKTD